MPAMDGGPRRKFWGWGREGEGLTGDEVADLGRDFAQRLSCDVGDPVAPPRIEEINLRPPRLEPPRSIAELFTTDPGERALHTYGRSYRDLVRCFRRDFSPAPDLVAYPRTENDVARVLDWCSDAGAAAIPFGGGSSVVGGVEPSVGEGYRGTVSVDLGGLGRVIEIDRASRSARIEGGVLGPSLEEQLRPHGLTLRHYPQAFEYSSLGGWIATRSGGHFATLFTHIDEFVQGLRVVTPRGVLETRRLPGSGAGPSPDRLFCGSEGTLGVITEAWMRLQDRPAFRAGASVEFESFADGAAAARAIAQSGLWPSNCRLLDHDEARLSGSGDGSRSILVVGFESADHPRDHDLDRALDLCIEHRGVRAAEAGTGAAERWRSAFLRGPHVRDAMVMLGLVHETFETAITWDRFDAFHEGVLSATRAALHSVCGGGIVSCRFAYVYPDGPSPYYSVYGPGRRGGELEQWDEIKAAAAEAIVSLGGTITHHHAVGRDHRPWYDRERPDLFAQALAAAKAELDPAGIMNPGVLLDPRRG